MFGDKEFYRSIPKALADDHSTQLLSEALLKNISSSCNTKQQVYLIGKALLPEIDGDYDETGRKFLTILSPNYKIIFLNYENNPEDFQKEFEQYQDDFIDDLRFLAKKFKYENVLGRPRLWKSDLIGQEFVCTKEFDKITDIFEKNKINTNSEEKRKIDMLISLLVGSINDINKIGEKLEFSSLLDQIKRQIILFDSNQTNFLYQEKSQDKIIIQGLSGTGKTELLLHKIRDIYLQENTVFFTCHNKILANTLKNRLIDFFNLFQVGEQIKWEERLWCERAWGSESLPNSGLYSLICHTYGIPFYSYRQYPDFESVCRMAIQDINDKYKGQHKKLLDYIVIDESQDFGDNFIELCGNIVNKQVIIAGDIFQNIFGTQKIDKQADFVLNKCYRTDPRTMMFAHGLSMGLFEPTKLQWLEDEEQWNFCGYLVENIDDGTRLILTRDPIRRFEELESMHAPIHIVENNAKDYYEIAKLIVEQIQNLIAEYSDITPSDVAVIYMSPVFGKKVREYNATVTNYIQYYLDEAGVEWPINRSYETADVLSNHLNITNYNNVKGLEFPFVICVDGQLSSSLKMRNATYMALTRSFLKTIYISTLNSYKNEIECSLLEILQDERMTISKPTEENLCSIHETNLRYDKEQRTYRDVVLDCIKEISSDPLSDLIKNQVYDLLYAQFGQLDDEVVLKEKIQHLIKFFQ